MMGNLFTVSAPSGAGKTSLVSALVDQLAGVQLSVSHTTRSQRPGEEDAVAYNFVSIDTFKTMIKQSAFLEHAEVFGNHYGTSENWVRERLTAGMDVILEIDWQGAAQVRQLIPETISIFIVPPSQSVLRNRLEGRGRDTEETIRQRMAQARDEISHFGDADYLIVNDDFNIALEELCALVAAQRLNIDKQSKKYAALLQDLLC